MQMIKNKFDEILNEINVIDSYGWCEPEEVKNWIEDTLRWAVMNYLEEDVINVIDSYGDVLTDYFIESFGSKYIINSGIVLPTQRNIISSKKFNAKVYLILKLLANNKSNNVVTKKILIDNKEKILDIYNITEKEFVEGFYNLSELGLIEETEEEYKLILNKTKGYYQAIDRDTCEILAKESNRTVKVYQYIRDFLKDENDLFENSKGIVNYSLTNYGTGYKDKKSLKKIIDRLVEIELIERTTIREGTKIHYAYEVFNSSISDIIDIQYV